MKSEKKKKYREKKGKPVIFISLMHTNFTNTSKAVESDMKGLLKETINVSLLFSSIEDDS